MPCTSVLGTESARDFLNMFATRLTKLCSSYWDEIIEVESPWHRILTNFIRNVPMEEEYVRTQLKLTAIPSAKQFKLLCIELCHKDSPSKRSLVVDAARRLNKSSCYPFAYNDSLLVLYYSDSEDPGIFSGPRVERELFESDLGVSSEMRVGLSKVFHDIREIDIAYQQACLTLNLAPYIVAERELANFPVENYCFSFESVFSYYMFIETHQDNRLSKSSMRYGVLRTLAKEDAELGTEVVKLLWTYLCNERNATAVSKQLHVHRNTVLYHIEKVEKRFSINLDDSVTRNCLLDEFHLYFLTKGFTEEPDYQALLRINEVSERTLG
ncbi:MAG: PucR family transcriptional regulator, partial [Coriobacteriales bacterium]